VRSVSTIGTVLVSVVGDTGCQNLHLWVLARRLSTHDGPAIPILKWPTTSSTTDSSPPIDEVAEVFVVSRWSTISA
jgi:hypothetical protein